MKHTIFILVLILIFLIMRIPICKLDFRKFPAMGLDTLTELVLSGIYQNPAPFATPPVDEATYRVTKDNFVNALVAYEKFGKTKKTDYTTAKKAMVAVLNTLAAYVNAIALGDASTIVLSGFEASKALPQPTQPLGIINNFSVKRSENVGEIIVTIATITNAASIHYGCICVKGKPLDNESIVNGQFDFPDGAPAIRYDCNKSRRKVFSGLTVGQKYYFYVFAINAISVSPLSGVRELMAA